MSKSKIEIAFYFFLLIFILGILFLNDNEKGMDGANKNNKNSEDFLKEPEISYGIWSNTEVVSTESTANSYVPTIAVDHNENIHVAWKDYTNFGGSESDADIFYKFWNSSTSTWNYTEVVSTESTSDSSDPSIDLDSSGNVHITWHDATNYDGSGSDTDIFYKIKNSTTGIWTTTEVVSTGCSSDSLEPSLKIDASDTIHIAWCDSSSYGGSDKDILYKTKDSITNLWSVIEVVSTQSTGNSLCPSVAIDGSNNIHVAWQDVTDYGGAGSYTDIFYKQKGASSGSWTNTEVVSPESTAPAFGASIAASPSGNIYIAYTDITDYGGGLAEKIIYKSRSYSSGSWSGPRVIDNGRDASLAIDNSGNIHIVWSGVYYTSRTSGMWTPIKKIDWETLSNGLYPAITAHGNGKAHVVWYSSSDYGSSGNDHDIFYKNNFELPEESEPIYVNGNQGWINLKNAGRCTGSGTSNDPYVIENQVINGYGASSCILIENSDVHFIIRNCKVYNSGGSNYPSGIRLENTKNGNIYNNNCSNNYRFATYGIYLRNNCDNNNITGNIINDNRGGLYTYDSSNNIIKDNIICKNAITGINIFYYSNDNVISDNYIYYNEFYGISSQSSINNLIYKNNISENGLIGGVSQARDLTSNNYWDNGFIGNYWSDYVGSDANDDGIGDNSYNGIENNRDYYPIYEDGDDTAPPNITVISPILNQICGVRAPDFKISIKGLYQNTTWYSAISGTSNHTFLGFNGKINQNLWNEFGNGSVILRFYVNDSLGNTNFDEVTVLKDIYSPTLKIISPVKNELFGKTAPNFTITVNETNLDTMWYTLDGGLTNITFTENDTFDLTEWNSLKNGTNTIVFYANDSAGNLAFISVNVQIDIIEPTIKINKPLSQQVFKNSPEFNVRINDTNFHKSWYTLNLDPTKYFFTENETIDPDAWGSFIDGPITITFCANDTVGNINFTSISIVKDTTAPDITIISPYNGQVFNDTAPYFTVEFFDYSLNKTWYSINGSKYFEFIINETFNSLEWNKLKNGTFTVTFFANDTFGHENFQTIYVNKDIKNPMIKINNPALNYIYGSEAPDFDISINEGNLHSTWYCLVNASDISDFTINTTFNYKFDLTFLQSIWDEIDNGSIVIWFFANDTAGNLGYNQTIINKDVIPPQIIINNPKHDLEFGATAPTFNITIIEGNLNKTWYTINGSASKYFFSELVDIINQEAWNNLINGIILIKFMANDTMSNIGYQEITITKYVPKPPAGGGGGGGGGGSDESSEVGGIPFGNYYLTFIIIGIISLIILTKPKIKILTK